MIWLSLFFFKQKTAYEMRISDWSSDVCSSDLGGGGGGSRNGGETDRTSENRFEHWTNPSTMPPKRAADRSSFGDARHRPRTCAASFVVMRVHPRPPGKIGRAHV